MNCVCTYDVGYPMAPARSHHSRNSYPILTALRTTQLGGLIIVKPKAQNYVALVTARINLILLLLTCGLPVLYYIKFQASAGRFLCYFVFATARLVRCWTNVRCTRMKPLSWSPWRVKISAPGGIGEHIMTKCDIVVGSARQEVGCRFAALARL